ncbi:hypothetical protein H1P_30005 [Hyella patelloides LEGE 07179]|uniref:Transposase n=1 Tax=Hyella patelloides LEGE 07179 TaxID=945734 RepID=A0A563VU69_9CYAN|nr:hypothetical protein H1P_30005 [Hyella patelloides LEGE 07179]
MQVRDFHKTYCNVVHGFRFNVNVKALSQMIEEKYHDEPLPHHTLPFNS